MTRNILSTGNRHLLKPVEHKRGCSALRALHSVYFVADVHVRELKLHRRLAGGSVCNARVHRNRDARNGPEVHNFSRAYKIFLFLRVRRTHHEQ